MQKLTAKDINKMVERETRIGINSLIKKHDIRHGSFRNELAGESPRSFNLCLESENLPGFRIYQQSGRYYDGSLKPKRWICVDQSSHTKWWQAAAHTLLLLQESNHPLLNYTPLVARAISIGAAAAKY